jgi:hypothetical protein
MAAAIAIPDDQTVYRGLRNSNWHKRQVVSYRAFLLRPADEKSPPETELSLGLTPESAVCELREEHGTAALSVLSVHSLRHGLRVLPKPGDTTKAGIHGLPLHSTVEAERDLAMTVASDLAGICWYVAVPKAN